MKQITLTILLALLSWLSIFGQKLTLLDLTNLCNKKNWEDVNQSLVSKKWTYYDSKKGSTSKYSTITWSFNKEYYSEKAHAWFDLYTYEGYPNKIAYSVFNKESYSIIQKSIASAGFKLVNSEIKDNEIISIYANANYTLEISTEKRDNSDDYSSGSKSLTAYNFTLIKKAGIYDPDNGKKTETYYDGTIKAEYTLVNGKPNGLLKTYYENSNIKKTASYVNGIENGLFKEYDEVGNLEVEYSMSNGELNGSIKSFNSIGKLKKSGYYVKGVMQGNFIEYDEKGAIEAEYVMVNGFKNGVLKNYKDGKINALTTFKDDIKNGQILRYIYDETGKLKFKQIGNYLDDEKNGTWQLCVVEEDNSERVLTFENYTTGLKNGQFQEVKGDSLIIGNYRNDKLHGEYRVFIDIYLSFFGSVIRTDTTRLNLIAEGRYYENKESGYWKFYEFGDELTSEGQFLYGLKTGEWKNYYPKWSNDKGLLPYAQELFLVQNYSNGKLDGISTKYSFIVKEEIPCSERDKNRNPLDTCERYVYEKVLETTFYKNDKRNGPFQLLDSLNEIISKGNFKDDLKEGEWIEKSSFTDLFEVTYFFYEKGCYLLGTREGGWIQYYPEGKIDQTFNYKNGALHGELIMWNQYNKPSVKKQLSNGKLTEVITFDSLGINPEKKYEIFDEKNDSYKCRLTQFLDSSYISQEYWVEKNEEINHYYFVLLFNLSISPISDDPLTIGYKDGDFILANYDNQPLIIGKFHKEDRIGLWTFYYYKQSVKIELNFVQGMRTDEKYLTLNGELFSGEFVSFDDKNGIKEERKIKDGLRNGKTKYIDIKSGKSIKKESYKNGVLI